MNHYVPGWNFEGDQVTNQKKSIGPDHELVELLWQNGQVVLNSQTQRIRKLNDQPRQATQDEESVSWIQNPFEECLEKEFCSSLFNDLPSLDSFRDDSKEPAKQLEEHKLAKFTTPSPSPNPNPNPKPNHVVAPLQQPNPMPPPRFQLLGSAPKSNSFMGFGSIANLGRVSLASKADRGAMPQGRVGEGSTMTVGSSHCGSNQVQNDHDFSRASTSGIGTTGMSARPLKDNLHRAITQETTTETTLTASSGFSTEDKRKRSDMEESEGAELESADGNKSLSRQSRSSKRSRAAEVHNLSERRRRDRINEKMKALQDLIPHCSKTDKASMLDEAIEYLKSLQLQLQVMWMGGGMGPMMFPSAQHYMSRMSMGMGLPRVPLINPSVSVSQTPNQAVMCQNQAMSHVNYSNQMQTQSLTEQYSRYLSFHQMQNSTQPMNMNMLRFGSQQSHSVAPPVSSIGSYGRGATTNDALSGKTSY